MSQNRSPTALVEFAGRTMKQCAACPALFNAAIPGARCSECGGPTLHPAPEWVDMTDFYRANFPAPITIIEEAHFPR